MTAWLDSTKLSEETSSILKQLYPVGGPYTEVSISRKLKQLTSADLPQDCKKNIVEVRNEIKKAIDCKSQVTIKYDGPLKPYDIYEDMDKNLSKFEKFC